MFKSLAEQIVESMTDKPIPTYLFIMIKILFIITFLNKYYFNLD